MKRFAASLVAAAALLGSTLAGTALAQDTRVKVDAPQAVNAQQSWNDQSSQDRYGNQGQGSDQDHYGNQGQGSNQDRHGNQGSGSDRNGSNWGGQGRFGRNMLEGRWAADNQANNYRSDRGNYRGRGPMSQVLLPDFIKIDQKPSMVRIADSKNHALQLIMLGGKFDSGRNDKFDSGRGGNLDYVQGTWHGSTLVVERSTGRGGTITQTFSLQDRGRTLVVRTRREGNGPRTMEITSTYHRA